MLSACFRTSPNMKNGEDAPYCFDLNRVREKTLFRTFVVSFGTCQPPTDRKGRQDHGSTGQQPPTFGSSAET